MTERPDPPVIYALMVNDDWRAAARELKFPHAPGPDNYTGHPWKGFYNNRFKKWPWGTFGKILGTVSVVGALLLNAWTSYSQHQQNVHDQAMHVSFWTDETSGQHAYHLVNSSADPINAVWVVFTADSTGKAPIYFSDELDGVAPCTEIIWSVESLHLRGEPIPNKTVSGKAIEFQDRVGRIWLKDDSGVLEQQEERQKPKAWATAKFALRKAQKVGDIATLAPAPMTWGELKGQPTSRSAPACSTR